MRIDGGVAEHLVHPLDQPLGDDVLEQLGPAVNGGKAIFLYGPPGNGKTVIAEGMGKALGGDMYVPHAITIDGQIVTMYDNYGYLTEVIVASVRNPLHVVESAMAGADIATIPYSVIKQLANHPLTDAGLKKFMEDYVKQAERR